MMPAAGMTAAAPVPSLPDPCSAIHFSSPFWDHLELNPTSVRPWFRRASWSKARLTSPSSPTCHEPASPWRKAGTRRGDQGNLESPDRSVIFLWRLYRSSSAWHIHKIKICKIYQICKTCKICTTYTRSLQSRSASTSASVLGTNLGRIFCRWMPIARWIMI